MSDRLYLVWLEWPEVCFRIDAKALSELKRCVPKGSRVMRVRSERAFLRALPRATHVLTWHFKSEWFASAPNLRLVATPAAGRELVPSTGPETVTIHFGHYHGPIIAETVVAFMLAWCRGFFTLERREISNETGGGWPRAWFSDKCRLLAGTKAVIIGYGHIGRAIGEKLQALGVSVVGVTRHRPAAKGLFKTADWVILALPATRETDHYVDAAFLKGLSRGAILINIGRGNAIDEAALTDALESGRLGGAYLDVREGEPKPRAIGHKNLVLSPHSSAFTPTYMTSFIRELVDDGVL